MSEMKKQTGPEIEADHQCEVGRSKRPLRGDVQAESGGQGTSDRADRCGQAR